MDRLYNKSIIYVQIYHLLNFLMYVKMSHGLWIGRNTDHSALGIYYFPKTMESMEINAIDVEMFS